ncbi:GNAT family N-acetyltransferase [Streptomyces violaceorubidus]
MGPGGLWLGTLTVFVEEAGTTAGPGSRWSGGRGTSSGCSCGPSGGGAGLTKALFDAGLEWARANGLERMRLIVHPDNGRAQGAYRKAGFVPSGRTVPLVGGPGDHELEYVLER